MLFLQYQILKAQKRISHDEYWCHVKQFILASSNSYCNFHILFIYYVLYYTIHCELAHCTFYVFISFLLIALESRYCPCKRFILASQKVDHRSVKRTSCNS